MAFASAISLCRWLRWFGVSVYIFLIRNWPLLGLLFLVRADAFGAATSTPAAPVVTITGGADETGQTYTWTITHDHPSPIVRVEFPHYRGGWSIPPEGWTSEITNRGGTGGRRGKFIASAGDPSQGIARGDSAEFRLVLVPEGTPRGHGDVLVCFSDGSEVLVHAQVPVKESTADRSVTLIGLGLIFGIFLLTRVLKRKRAHSSAPAESPQSPEDP